MAYFPHAFQKLLVATNATPFKIGDNTTGINGTIDTTPANLAAGQVAVVSNKNHKVVKIDGTPTYAQFPLVYLAQGSFHANDKLGGSLHGGYKESIKSKGINPKYVSAFYVTAPANPKANIIMVTAGVDCSTLTCDTTYRLRVDVKGSPALRFLTHNAYLTVDAYTGCCDAANSTVDPNMVLLQWKDQINASPLLKSLVLAKVWNNTGLSTTATASSGATALTVASAGSGATAVAAGQKVVGAGIPNNTFVGSVSGTTVNLVDINGASVATTAALSTTSVKFFTEIATGTYSVETGAAADTNDGHLDLIGAYAATSFNDCSFSPMDHVEYQPLEIYASVVEQDDKPCTTTCFGSSMYDATVVATVTTTIAGGIYQTQAPYQGKGFGETLVRELILSKRYGQEPWNQDPRMREVLDDTTLSEISRNSKYYVYHILHSVPRKSNPTGTMDADQYLVKIAVAARNTNFETWMNTLLASAGNDIQLNGVVNAASASAI